ncbi:MAG: P-II family nitrogen regulator [Nitrososphaera sp.]|jgi:nitrogen regulatory protein PII
MANTSLPFEVVDDKSKDKVSMKRVALLVRPEKVDAVIAAIRGLRIEAVIYDVKSAGKEKETVTSGRSMGTVDLAYTNRKLIVSIVDPEVISNMVDAVRNALGGKGSSGGGVMTVSPVDGQIRL